MRYRGFNITYTTDKGVERENPATHRKDIRNGYYCEIYPGDDDQYANRIDFFCLPKDTRFPSGPIMKRKRRSAITLTASIIL